MKSRPLFPCGQSGTQTDGRTCRQKWRNYRRFS